MIFKLFESKSNLMVSREICEKYDIKGYDINPDGSISINGDLGYVNLSNKGLIKIPLIFKEVAGYFGCSRNQLTSLEGCPEKVGGNFFLSS